MPPTFFGRKICWFLKKKYVSKYMFAFSGHMNFKTIAELLKTAPVFLKRLESFWHSELLYSVFKVT